VLAELVHGIGNVRACESGILEGPNYLTIVGRVGE
jgi:hypothetical protein